MNLLDHERVLKIILKIPHECYRTVYGEIYFFKLTDFTIALFEKIDDEEELRRLSKIVARELRELGCEIRRQHDHRRVIFFHKCARTVKRRKTRIRHNTR